MEGLRNALSERYVIERELGRGGHSVVYLAHDVKHDRKVALKVLQPELALAVRHERFLREIQIAAKLSHPHILPLYDSGRISGQADKRMDEVLYYVMPYVEGESLRDRLTREKQLSIEDALRITREVAEALAYAHKQGVVHRDIKPENILLHESHALVADFGIARALTVSSGQTVTESGIAVGTPAYMSPEQGAGSGEPDARSDIYSLGCVLYEMLAGHPPFTGGTAQEVLARHSMDDVPALRAARRAVPESVELAVQKALAKQPVDRFTTAARFAAALEARPGGPRAFVGRRVAAAVALVFVITAGALVGRQLLSRAPAADPSVAILPCKNLSTDPENEYLGEGIAEELITALTGVEGLRVPGRASSFSLAKSPNPVREAVGQLHVSQVVECSVRESRGQLRINVGLVDAGGNQVWAETFEGDANEQFAVQEKVARAVVAQLEGIARGSATLATLVRRSTKSPEAYDLYQRGRFFFYRRTREAMTKALDYFQRAIGADSAFALAYSGLADVYSLSAAGRDYVPLPRDEQYRLAKRHALKAIDLDSTVAEPWVSLARVRYIYDWDFPGAETAFRQAIRLDPNYPLAHIWYGLFLSWIMSPVGRCDDALREAQAGYQLDPLSELGGIGNVYRYCGRLVEAVEFYRRGIDLEPNVPGPHSFLALAYVKQQRYPEALAQLDTVAALRGDIDSPAQRSKRAYIFARTGQRNEAVRVTRELEQTKGGLPFRDLAVAYMALGDRDKAFEALNRAIETHGFTSGPSLGGEFEELASDPRYDQLLRKAGLK